jgi:hypothetical protein
METAGNPFRFPRFFPALSKKTPRRGVFVFLDAPLRASMAGHLH